MRKIQRLKRNKIKELQFSLAAQSVALQTSASAQKVSMRARLTHRNEAGQSGTPDLCIWPVIATLREDGGNIERLVTIDFIFWDK